MTRLESKIKASGKSYRQIAYEIVIANSQDPGHILRLHHCDVVHFAKGRGRKVGRATRKIIRIYFRSLGFLPVPAPHPHHVCPDCGRSHVIKSKVSIAKLVSGLDSRNHKRSTKLSQ